MNSDSNSPDYLAALKKRLAEKRMVLAQKVVSTDEDRYQGILIGNVNEEMLVIGEIAGVQFEVGEQIILHIPMDSQLVGFETIVITKVDYPLMYVVRFPDVIEEIKGSKIKVRKVERIRAFIPADVNVPDPGGGTYLVLTRILELSSGGCWFRSKTPLPISPITMTFSLPGNQHIKSAHAIVLTSSHAWTVYDIRAKFPKEGTNIPIIQEITNWVNDNQSFAAHAK